MSDPDVAAHPPRRSRTCEDLLRECEDQNQRADPEPPRPPRRPRGSDPGAAARARQSFTGAAQVPLLGRVPLTLVRDEQS